MNRMKPTTANTPNTAASPAAIHNTIPNHSGIFSSAKRHLQNFRITNQLALTQTPRDAVIFVRAEMTAVGKHRIGN